MDGPLTVDVPGEQRGPSNLRGGSGVMAELGVYDGILEGFGERPDRWLEFAVLVHLYARTNAEAYRDLVERYGHVAIKPDRNTAPLISPPAESSRSAAMTHWLPWSVRPVPHHRHRCAETALTEPLTACMNWMRDYGPATEHVQRAR